MIKIQSKTMSGNIKFIYVYVSKRPAGGTRHRAPSGSKCMKNRSWKGFGGGQEGSRERLERVWRESGEALERYGSSDGYRRSKNQFADPQELPPRDLAGGQKW